MNRNRRINHEKHKIARNNAAISASPLNLPSNRLVADFRYGVTCLIDTQLQK
jgi:hypothetical protein